MSRMLSSKGVLGAESETDSLGSRISDSGRPQKENIF